MQWASEGTIAAVERCGGTITTAYFDIHSLWAIRDPLKFFKKGKASIIYLLDYAVYNFW